MRHEDRVRILHMVEAAEALARFIGGKRPEHLDQDQMLLFAVVRAIEIFGEAANKVSPETQATAPQIPWAVIVAMRNRLVHGYFDTDAMIVWKTAAEEVPALLAPLRELAASAT